MPDGVAVTVAGGFALIEFLDPALRGPGVARLIEVGGASTIQKRTLPRPAYVVPEGNARAAGLLDTAPAPMTSAPVADPPAAGKPKRPRKPRQPAAS